MSTEAFVVLWSEVKPGREKMAGELFASTVSHYQKKVKDGTFESFEPALLGGKPGGIDGFFIVRGEREKLDAYRRTNEFKDWNVQAVHCLSGFAVVDAYIGDSLFDMMNRWNSAIPE